MKEVKCYVCETCGAVYGSYADAAKCEAEHKKKTRADVFFERFPHARRDIKEPERPSICLRYAFGEIECPRKESDGGLFCAECWNQPAPEEYQE